jgi:hypothetical protein
MGMNAMVSMIVRCCALFINHQRSLLKMLVGCYVREVSGRESTTRRWLGTSCGH